LGSSLAFSSTEGWFKSWLSWLACCNHFDWLSPFWHSGSLFVHKKLACSNGRNEPELNT
jgi:hypothetical protein